MIIPLKGCQGFRYPVLSSFVIVVLVSWSTLAQSDQNVKIDSGTGGRNTLQGDVYLPSGQRLGQPLLIKLVTPRGELTTTTNGNGAFVFRQLGGGRYTVKIEEGLGFAAASEVVEISESGFGGGMSRLGQTYTVQIHLRLLDVPSHTRGVLIADSPPNEAVELFEKALSSAREGARERAVEELKQAIKIDPRFVAALNGLGVQYIKLGEFEKAFESLSEALKIAPETPMLHLNAGIALLQLKRFDLAEVEFAKAIHGNDASAPAHFYRARALIGLRRLDEAEKELNKALAMGGNDMVIARRYLGGIYVEKGENDKAIRMLEQYLKSASQSNETIQIKRLISELQKKQKKG